MAIFRYRAADPAGRMVRGQIDAADRTAALGQLRGKGMTPVSLRTQDDGGGLFAQVSLPGRKSLSRGELVQLTRQLSTLLGSGVRVDDALATIARQAAPGMARLTRAMRAAVLDGRSFSAALGDHQQTFDAFFLASARAGEAAGRLGAVMEHLARHVDARARNRQSIQLALIYPAILALVSLAVITGLLVFVVPDIVRVFAARGAELPALTRGLIGLSDGIARWGPWLALVLGAAVVAGYQAMRMPHLRLRWHRFTARRRIARQIAAAQFSGTLATLTQSGVALADALGPATDTVGNLAYRATLREVAQSVRDGMALSRALARHPVFSPMMITMVASGEAGGTLPDAMARYADDTSFALDAMVKTLVGLVEPMVLLIMGGIVMALVLAILLPIVNLNNLVT